MTSSTSNGQNKSLLERVEMPDFVGGVGPEVPEEARQGLARLNEEFDRAEIENLRSAIVNLRPIFERRAAFVSSTPAIQAEFWRRVFAAAPAQVDSYVLPSDAEILGQSLRDLRVERFELDDKGAGEPRSVRFTFEFDPEENIWFEGNQIVKDFYWRKEVKKTKNGKRVSWDGFISMPVRIPWKEGKDPTKGLLDAACDLAAAEEKAKSGESKLSVEKRKGLEAYEKLVEKVAKLQADEEGDEGEDGEDPMTIQSPAGMSFFAWFGYRGKDITVEESRVAQKSDDERFEKMTKGEDVDLSDDDDEDDEFDDDDGLEDVEIFPDGEQLAAAISEELYPDAHKYYEQSYDVDSDFEFDSDIDLEHLLEGDDDENGAEAGAGEKENEEAPPRKKART